MQVEIVEADFANPVHCAGIVDALDSYASDPVGGGVPLSADVRERLVPLLRDHPTTLVLLALAESRVVGVAICLLVLSTFRARPVLNVHDLAVLSECRGKGVGRALLAAAEERARRQGCYMLSLEVQDGNQRAAGLYRSFGFADYALGDQGAARFLVKRL